MSSFSDYLITIFIMHHVYDVFLIFNYIVFPLSSKIDHTLYTKNNFKLECAVVLFLHPQVSEFKDQLFGSLGVPVQRIKEFSCGHVIPEENLLAVCLGRGPSGVQFDFTFKTRDSPEQVCCQ